MTKREKQIGIGVAAAVALFCLDQWVFQPYWDSRTKLQQDVANARSQIEDEHHLFTSERVLQPKWKAMVQSATGLKSDWNTAESQAENTVNQWATSLGVNITSLTAEGMPKAENKFLVINFHASGLGSMQAISRMLNSLEIGQVPIRITEIQITPRREGTDDLTIQMSISTLCLQPQAENAAPAKTPVASAASATDSVQSPSRSDPLLRYSGGGLAWGPSAIVETNMSNKWGDRT